MLYTLRFFLQNAVYFIILTYLVPVLFTFYTQGVLKLKKIIPAPKGEVCASAISLDASTGDVQLKSFVTLTARVNVEASPFRQFSRVKFSA